MFCNCTYEFISLRNKIYLFYKQENEIFIYFRDNLCSIILILLSPLSSHNYYYIMFVPLKQINNIKLKNCTAHSYRCRYIYIYIYIYIYLICYNHYLFYYNIY